MASSRPFAQCLFHCLHNGYGYFFIASSSSRRTARKTPSFSKWLSLHTLQCPLLPRYNSRSVAATLAPLAKRRVNSIKITCFLPAGARERLVLRLLYVFRVCLFVRPHLSRAQYITSYVTMQLQCTQQNIHGDVSTCVGLDDLLRVRILTCNRSWGHTGA